MGPLQAAKALELAGLTRAEVKALAIEDPLPAYAATIGDVEEVKREKDLFFSALATDARGQGEEAGVPLDVEVRPGHAATVICESRRRAVTTSSSSATAATTCATTCSARLRTGSPSTRPAPS